MVFPARSDLRAVSVSVGASRAWPNRNDLLVLAMLAAISVAVTACMAWSCRSPSRKPIHTPIGTQIRLAIATSTTTRVIVSRPPAWLGLVLAVAAWSVWIIIAYIRGTLGLNDVVQAVGARSRFASPGSARQ